MAQNRPITIQPGLMMKLMNEGLLCCHSSYMLLKYLSKGRIMMSFKVRVLISYDLALTVVFSKIGESMVSLGVTNYMLKALK